MARWVDASDAQKLRQYTQPAARRQIASGEFDAIRHDILARVEQAKAAHAANEITDRRLERRLADLRREWQSNNRAERWADWVITL